jgi:hypothetical protein
MDAKIAESGGKLERVAADTRRPFELGHRRRVLPRRQAAGVGLRGQDCQAVGRQLGHAAAHARS